MSRTRGASLVGVAVIVAALVASCGVAAQSASPSPAEPEGTVETAVEGTVPGQAGRPLLNTMWRMDGIGSHPDTSSMPPGVTAMMKISDTRLGVLTVDVFNGLTWLSAPGGQDGATGAFSGTVRVEPSADADPATPSSGVVHVSGGLYGDGIGCPADHPECFVDVSVLGSDFHFDIQADRLTVTGIGPTAGRVLTFHADDSPPDVPR